MKKTTVQVTAEPTVLLDADLTIPDGAQGIVVFAHNSGSDRHSPRNQQVAQTLNDAGLATLLLDLLTTNEQASTFDVPLLASRLAGTVDWLTRQVETRPLNIGLFGANAGAAAAVTAATMRPSLVSTIVSRGGRLDLALESLSLVKAPVLLIVGGGDEEGIRQNRQALERMMVETRVVTIPDAGSLFEEDGALEMVAAAAQDWFTYYLVNKD